ncbi:MULTISPECIES: hypothetical protein [unclassified Pseudomonas]|uniref:hypothetical protein n=1 Tax=unclassified Pseudomonas TaxID=196821 RepID=UPI0024495173|nr:MULTISPECIES: hypothetical protein [unclassified Pseudomonas]MDH0300617.1 hypothetical protein [Pseudomonas sp. GD04091]MDH1984232.1 hypothetical protein [Pseudomonas sp. GD03689]
MATGFLAYAPDGTLLIDMTTSISQMLGYVDTGAVDGSAVLPSPPPGRTLFYAVAELSEQDRGLGKRPGITLVGTTLSWAYSYAGGWGFYSLNCRIHYGYY